MKHLNLKLMLLLLLQFGREKLRKECNLLEMSVG